MSTFGSNEVSTFVVGVGGRGSKLTTPKPGEHPDYDSGVATAEIYP